MWQTVRQSIQNDLKVSISHCRPLRSELRYAWSGRTIDQKILKSINLPLNLEFSIHDIDSRIRGPPRRLNEPHKQLDDPRVPELEAQIKMLQEEIARLRQPREVVKEEKQPEIQYVRPASMRRKRQVEFALECTVVARSSIKLIDYRN